MSTIGRTALHQEVIEALLESNVVDFEAIGGVLAKFGARAARDGSEFGVLIGRRVMDVCIPPYVDLTRGVGNVEFQG